MSKSRDCIRDLPYPDSSPKFVLFIHREPCVTLSAKFAYEGSIIDGRLEGPGVFFGLTISVDIDTIATF